MKLEEMERIASAIAENRFYLYSPDQKLGYFIVGDKEYRRIKALKLIQIAVAAGADSALSGVKEHVDTAIEPLKAKVGALDVALDTMFTWMNENGIQVDYSTPVPTITNTRAVELEKMLRVAAERAYKDEIIDTDSEEDKIGEWKDYADKEDWIRSWIDSLKEE